MKESIVSWCSTHLEKILEICSVSELLTAGTSTEKFEVQNQ